METDKGDSIVEELEHESNGANGSQDNGESESQSSKPAMKPMSLFGSSASLLKEAELNSLRSNGEDEKLEIDESEENAEPVDERVETSENGHHEKSPEVNEPEPIEQLEEEKPEIQEEEPTVVEEEGQVQEEVPVVEPKKGRRSVREEPVPTPKSAKKVDTPAKGRGRKSAPVLEEEPEQTEDLQEEPQTEPQEETPVSETKRGRRSTREVLVPTPKSEKKSETPAKGRGRKSAAAEKPEERAEEDASTAPRRSRRPVQTPKEVPTPTPKTAKRGRKPALVTNESDNQEASEEEEQQEKTPATSGRGRRSFAAKVETPREETAQTPKSAKKRGRKPSLIDESVEQHEDAEPQEATPSAKRSRRSNATKVETPQEATPKTPKIAAKKKETPAKGSAKKGRKSEHVINLDNDDPFNFDAQAYNHPEPLTNFNVQKQNFGEIKFMRSPLTTNIENRYANTEKAAAKNTVPIILTPAIRPASITALTTTPDVQNDFSSASSSKATGSKKRGRKAKTPDIYDQPTENKQKTPRRTKREQTPLQFAKPKVEIILPELSAEEQVEADYSHEPHPSGTRVFALWGNDYYPATIFDRDGLGRYKVIYTEDQQNRDVPLPGVITFGALAVGHTVSITVTKDDEESLQPVKITSVPNKSDPTKFLEGDFEGVEVNEDGEASNSNPKTYNWKQLFIAKSQQKDIVHKLKNQAVIVDEGNAVPRSARRSRLAATNVLSQSISGSAKKSQTQEETANDDQSTNAQTPKKRGRKSAVQKQEKSNEEPTVSRTPKKRGRKSAAATAEEKRESPKAKRQLLEKSKGAEKMEIDANEAEDSEEIPNQVLEDYYFMLTSSSTRRANAGQFNKREFKELVENLGGTIVEEISELQALVETNKADKAFLVADTYYRTHKYLFALAASIPCLHYSWLTACAEKKELVKYEPFMLKAGSSVVDGEEYEWKTLKGKLFKNKTIFVHSINVDANDVVQFAEIWRPLLQLLGANVITCEDIDVSEVVDFCDKTEFDFMLTDRSCYPEVLACVEKKDIPAVSSNWIIHAIITGELADVSVHQSFSPHD